MPRISTVAAALALSLTVVLTVSGCGQKEKSLRAEGKQKLPALPQVSGEALNKRWSRDVGGSYRSGEAVIVPAVGDGRVFAADPSGRVTGLELATGKPLWEARIDEPITAGVGYGSSLAVVATSEGRVIGLDANNGKEVWRSYVAGEVLAQPVIVSDVVIIRTIDGRVLGLRVTSGDRDWGFARQVPGLSLRGTGRPVVYEGVAVNGFANGKIVASEAATGRVLWEISVANTRGRNEIERLIDIDAQPLLIGSVLYTAAYQGEISALALGSRKLLWKAPVSSHRELDADANSIYVTSDEGVVVSIDRLTGTERWRQTAFKGRNITGPTSAGGKIFVGDEDGFMHALDPVTGAVNGRTRVGGEVVRRSETDGSNVFTMTRNGALTVFSAR